MKKKKGSSFVFVLLLTSTIMLLGTIALMTVSSDMKSRIQENKRIQSLYGADAGIGYAHYLIAQTFYSATKYAEREVALQMQTKLKNDAQLRASLSQGNLDSKLNDEMNDIFQTAFASFIDLKDSNEFIESMKRYSYVDFTEKFEKDYVKVKFSETSQKEPVFDLTLIKNGHGSTPYEFKLLSEFESVENGLNNVRQIETKYRITIPDYVGQSISQSIDIYKVFHDKVITVDENLTISGAQLLTTINGKTQVIGTQPPSSLNAAYDKYMGGITINGASVLFTDDVATAKTLQVEGSGRARLEQNLYARNLYVGSISGAMSSGFVNVLQAANLDNDLTLNASDSVVEIKDFYGLNDKTYTGVVVTDEDIKNHQQTVERVSSSIIVNGNQNTSLRILNSAYIMGVAYINTIGQHYQTGESVAIKGNYVAYTHPLPDSASFGQAEFSYYEPLQLVDKVKGKDLTVVQKSEYFKEFYSKPANGTPSHGGVELPSSQVYTAGAAVYKKDGEVVVETTHFNSLANERILKQRELYAQNVYAMGYTKDNKLNLYETLGIGSNQDYVSTLIDWKVLEANCLNTVCQMPDLQLVSNKKILVMGSNQMDSKYDGSEYIRLGETQAVQAFIVSNGDVIIDGAIDFTGNIISSQNLILTGSGVQDLNYDATVTHNLIAKHYDRLQNIFLGDKISTQLVNQFENIDGNQYDTDQYIKTKHWKIVK